MGIIKPERLIKDMRRVIRKPLPVQGLLEVGVPYSRLQDDHDGTGMGRLTVTFSQDGDAWVMTDSHRLSSMRFRVPDFGGGRSPHTRNGLILLALGMKQDNENDTKKK